VDIGGRSTEMILGQGYTAHAMESYRLGSVAWSGRYFARGAVSAAAFKTAEVAAKAVLDEALDTFPPAEWNVAYGSSGTVSAVAEMLGGNGWAMGLVTRAGLDWLTDRLVKAGNVDNLRLDGLKDDRRPVLAGGLSVLRAIFDLFDIQQMLPAQGALRHGALYDLIDRDDGHSDLRAQSVARLAARFAIDQVQAHRVARVAAQFLRQLRPGEGAASKPQRKLAWAAQLHEIGCLVAHSDYHKHGAYILDHADAPGFSQPELHRLGLLVLGHRGKLRKLEDPIDDPVFVQQLLALRLAVILCHARREPDLQGIHLQKDPQVPTYRLILPSGWEQQYPQSAHLLREECIAWQKAPWRLNLRLA